MSNVHITGNKTFVAARVLAPVLLLVACSSNGTATSASTGDGGGATPAGATVSVSGTVVLAPQFSPDPGIEGCVLDSMPPTCATSLDDGTITIALPADSRTGITYAPADSIPEIVPIFTQETDITLTGRAPWTNGSAGVVIPTAIGSLIGNQTGIDLDPQKGYVDFSAGSLGEGKVTVDGDTTTTAWYTAAGVPYPASMLDGGAPGVGSLYGIINIDPGMVTFRAEKNGTPCTWDPTVWPGTEPGTITVPIRAGTWTRLFEARCD